MRSCSVDRLRVAAHALRIALIALALSLLGALGGCRCGGGGGSDAGATDAAATDAGASDAGPRYAATPIGLAVGPTTVYVTGAALDATFTPGPGFVAAIDRSSNTETDRAVTSAPQPQFLAFDPTNDALLVASSGIVDFSMFPAVFLSAAGAVDVYPATDLAVSTSIPLMLGAGPQPAGGGLGPIAAAALPGGGSIVFGGSALTGDLYSFDPAAGTVLAGPASPIAFFAVSTGFTGVHETASGLVVTDFSTDDLCVGGDPAADLAGATCVNLRADPGTPIGVQKVCSFAGPVLWAIANLSGELLSVSPNGTGFDVLRVDLGGAVDPQGLSCGADGIIYVTLSFGQDRIARFDPADSSLDLAWLALPAGATPRDVVVAGPPPYSGYVAASGNDTVVVFDVATAAITDTIPIAAP